MPPPNAYENVVAADSVIKGDGVLNLAIFFPFSYYVVDVSIP